MIKILSIFLLLLFAITKSFAASCPTKDEGFQLSPDKKWTLTHYAETTGWEIIGQNANEEISPNTFVEAKIYYSIKAGSYRIFCKYYMNHIRVLTLINSKTNLDLKTLDVPKKFKQTKYDLVPEKDYHEYDVYHCSTNISTTKNCDWEY